jgi:hypothetical protein
VLLSASSLPRPWLVSLLCLSFAAAIFLRAAVAGGGNPAFARALSVGGLAFTIAAAAPFISSGNHAPAADFGSTYFQTLERGEKIAARAATSA